MTEIEKKLRQELKEQIKENQELIAEIKELNVDNEWWNNRYKAQVRINEEHKKINGELRKEIDGLVTVIDLVKEYLTGYECISTIQGTEEVEKNKGLDEKTIIEIVDRCIKVHNKVLEILERVNEK